MVLDTNKFEHIPGWCGEPTAKILYDCMLKAPVARALELGTYAGKSACIIAQALKDRGDNGVLIACDYFPQELNYRGTIIKDPLSKLWEHLKNLELENYLITIRGNHASTLTQIQTKLGLVYIDGGHYLERVLADGLFAWKFLEPGGFIVFHDYGHPDYPDVRLCVDMLANLWQVELSYKQTTAYVQKPV